MSTQNEIIYIGCRREPLWDDALVEEATAVLRQHQPIEREIALEMNAPWEGEYCGYPVVFQDSSVIRLYYNAGKIILHEGSSIHHGPVAICYAESDDGGKSFVKPDLGIYEFNGSRCNNIIMMGNEYLRQIDNFTIFKDTNPDCPPDERYKAITEKDRDTADNKKLGYFASADGIHFFPVGDIVSGGWFDSMNCCFWDHHSGQYFLYMRDWAEGYHRNRGNKGFKMRGIRYCTSKDFKVWSPYQPVQFNHDEPIELYTNQIKPYYRADHVFLGMPSRYIERENWEPNFDYLPNPDHRRLRSRINMRFGTALTDCVLITSRDGVHFRRWEEAFLTPGLESGYNWVYGDCYPSWGMVETASPIPGRPDEISLFCMEYHWQKPQVLRRYTIRQDGFISYHAPYQQSMILTKPLSFEGSRLTINFTTSAAGYIRIRLLDMEGHPIEGYAGYDIFGDSLDRPVIFEAGEDLSRLAGQPVRMYLEMRDADIYSFRFC